jgi:putative phosphatase
MFRFIRPNLRLDSVLDLPAERLAALKINALLLDLDCTLKDYHSTRFAPGVAQWIQSLQAADVKLCLLSNGQRRRVEPFSRELNIPSVTKALKPFPFGCWRATRLLRSEQARTALVGDQLFADVLAGRIAGLFTILVRPTSSEEPWFTRLKRPLERRCLAWLDKQ